MWNQIISFSHMGGWVKKCKKYGLLKKKKFLKLVVMKLCQRTKKQMPVLNMAEGTKRRSSHSSLGCSWAAVNKRLPLSPATSMISVVTELKHESCRSALLQSEKKHSANKHSCLSWFQKSHTTSYEQPLICSYNDNGGDHKEQPHPTIGWCSELCEVVSVVIKML